MPNGGGYNRVDLRRFSRRVFFTMHRTQFERFGFNGIAAKDDVDLLLYAIVVRYAREQKRTYLGGGWPIELKYLLALLKSLIGK